MCELRHKVHTVQLHRRKAISGTRPVALAGVTLSPDMIIAHRRRGESLEPVLLGATSHSVLPTYVIVVPSALNPDFLDATLAVSPNAISWLFRRAGGSGHTLEKPAVRVPLYLAPSTPREVRFRTHHPSMNAHLDKTSHIQYTILR